MAANWMRAKLDKLKVERKLAAANSEQVDLFNLVTFTPRDDDVDAMVQAFHDRGGKVKEMACANIVPRNSYGVMGKGKRTQDRRTGGNFKRKGLCHVGAMNMQPIKTRSYLVTAR
jgi:hypothetical protein